MGQIDWTISLVMIGLFTIAVVGFGINFAIDNNSPIDIANDAQISGLFVQVNENISGYNEDAEDTYTSIVNSSINAEGFTTQSAGQFAITPANVIGVTNNIVRVGYIKIFGNDGGFSVFMTSFIGLIVFITGLLLWKTWGGRNPE